MAWSDKENPEKDGDQSSQIAESDQDDASQQQDDPAQGFEIESNSPGRGAERKQRL